MRSKQGSIVTRGPKGKQRLYARIRWKDPVTGEPREKLKRVRNRTEGREVSKQMLRELDDHGPQVFAAKQSLTFRQLAEHYAAAKVVEAEYRGPVKIRGMRSVDSARVQLNTLIKHFGDRPAASIDYEDVLAFKEARLLSTTKRGTAPKEATVNRELERLRAVLRFAKRKRWLTEIPFDDGEPLISKANELRRDRLPTDEEEARLLELCTGRRAHMRGILIALSDTGMRPSEAFRLQWIDVNLAGRVILLKKENTKTQQPRWLGMTDRLHAVLTQLWEQSLKEPDGLVFGIQDNVRKAFASLCRDAKIKDLQLRDFRNKTSTDYQLAGIPDALAMKGTGHMERRTYEGYVKVDQDIARQLAQRLEEHRRERQQEREKKANGTTRAILVENEVE